MRKLAAVMVALIACVAIAAPLKRTIEGRTAAGAAVSHRFGNYANPFAGSLASVAFMMDAPASGSLYVKMTRPGLFTNLVVYTAVLSNATDHVVWFENSLAVRGTDQVSISNGTDQAGVHAGTLTE